MTTELEFTFDDGPSEFTPAILELLAAAGVKATFFMVGREVERRPEVARAVLDAGHAIGNHSYSHPRLAELPDAEVRGELRRCTEALTAAGIPRPELCRPPYGSTDDRVEGLIRAEGMRQVLWDIDPEDWDASDAEQILARIRARAGRGRVLLLHDGRGDRSATVAAVRLLLTA